VIFDRLTDIQHSIIRNQAHIFGGTQSSPKRQSGIAFVCGVGCVSSKHGKCFTFDRPVPVLCPSQNHRIYFSFIAPWQEIRAIPFCGSSCSSASLGQWRDFVLFYGSFSWYVHIIRKIAVHLMIRANLSLTQMLQVFEECLPAIKDCSGFLEKFVTWPRTCGRAIVRCESTCPQP
jgi:hypothetical protein